MKTERRPFGKKCARVGGNEGDNTLHSHVCTLSNSCVREKPRWYNSREACRNREDTQRQGAPAAFSNRSTCGVEGIKPQGLGIGSLWVNRLRTSEVSPACKALWGQQWSRCGKIWSFRLSAHWPSTQPTLDGSGIANSPHWLSLQPTRSLM